MCIRDSFKRDDQFHTCKFWITAELVGGSPINRKSGYLTRNLLLFYLSCDMEGSFLPLSKNVGCFAKVPASLRKKTKLGSKTVGYIFIGLRWITAPTVFEYTNQKYWICVQTMIIKARDVVFFEDIFPYKQKEIRLLGKEHTKHRSAMKDPVNKYLMRKLTQGVRDR